MPVSVGKIADQVNTKILEGGQNFIDAARLVGSVEALESRFSVANLASLPPAADNTGRFIYVEDIEAYRYSDGTQWTNDYDTTLSATSGQLWAWGGNAGGALGDGTLTSRCSPVREFCSATDWCQVSTGGRVDPTIRQTTGAIKTSGELWMWGTNNCGQVGDGTKTARCSPVREFCSATNWCQVSTSTGYRHTIAVKTSGELWAWGDNGSGRLGDGTATTRCSPVREFCSATDWCQASAGDYHTAAVKTSGELWVWGGNSLGRLGDGTYSTSRSSPVREFCSATDWCQVSAMRANTIAIKTSGELWAWGWNSSGQIGDGTTETRCSPVREICSATDWCQTDNNITRISAVKTSGQIWVWGVGLNLGDGTSASRCSPVREFCSATDWCQVSTGSSHTLAVKTSGELWVWGNGKCGSLGDGTAAASRSSPVREFCSATDWCQVSAGRDQSAAIKITKGFNEP